jgi:hypothetical protein
MRTTASFSPATLTCHADQSVPYASLKRKFLQHISAGEAFTQRWWTCIEVEGKRVQLPRDPKAFGYIWIYLLGLIFAVAVILMFFGLNPAAESPPFP